MAGKRPKRRLSKPVERRRILSDAQLYCNLMADVRGRLDVLRDVIAKTVALPNDLARLEFSALLLRKSMEQVAIGSLISNRDAYCAAFDEFQRVYHARKILRDIERVNPHFYPMPVVQEGKPEPGRPMHYRLVDDGFLTRDEFVKAYDKCAALLHAANPHGSTPSYAYFDRQIPLWADKLTRLLDLHVLRLVGAEIGYLIHMQESDGRVHHYTLSLDRVPKAVDN